MTKGELREIYEAIAVAMNALETDGEDLRTDEDDEDEYALVGKSFQVVFDDQAEAWIAKERS